MSVLQTILGSFCQAVTTNHAAISRFADLTACYLRAPLFIRERINRSPDAPNNRVLVYNSNNRLFPECAMEIRVNAIQLGVAPFLREFVACDRSVSHHGV